MLTRLNLLVRKNPFLVAVITTAFSGFAIWIITNLTDNSKNNEKKNRLNDTAITFINQIPPTVVYTQYLHKRIDEYSSSSITYLDFALIHSRTALSMSNLEIASENVINATNKLNSISGLKDSRNKFYTYSIQFIKNIEEFNSSLKNIIDNYKSFMGHLVNLEALCIIQKSKFDKSNINNPKGLMELEFIELCTSLIRIYKEKSKTISKEINTHENMRSSIIESKDLLEEEWKRRDILERAQTAFNDLNESHKKLLEAEKNILKYK